MLEIIVDGLLEDSEQLSITLKTRSGISRRKQNTTQASHTIPSAKTREINFPGSNVQEAWRFSTVAYIVNHASTIS